MKGREERGRRRGGKWQRIRMKMEQELEGRVRRKTGGGERDEDEGR